MLAQIEGSTAPPTLDDLCARITSEHYTLLHLVAHGWFRSRDGETIVYLLDADGAVRPVPATRLLERLDQLQGVRGLPHLVFLSTCDSGAPEAEAEAALGGLAQRLVRELGMPAVVAMTEKVSIATAQALAQNFYRRLREHGEVDRALVEASATLADAGDVLVPALYSRLGGRPLFSDTLDRELTESEIEFALTQLQDLLPERAPVLQAHFESIAATLRQSQGIDRATLSAAAREEHEQALTALNAMCEEVLDVNFRTLALGTAPPAYDSRCPFPGLYAFQADDREFFFGREALVAAMLERLHTHPFLATVGASGSGKSSLVLAGLVPALQAQYPELQQLYMTPGSDPVERLEHTLGPLSTSSESAAVLVVDQFEELFTLCHVPAQRQAFLERLLALVGDATNGNHASPRFVVLTMRADFWGECAPYPGLKTAMQAHQELLAAMNTAELRSAMEQQAAQVGLRFEADLSHTILAAVQDEPGAMPLLQHLLQELWKRRHGRWLKTSEYHDLGGIQQAIAHTADAVYAELPEGEQEYMRNLFIRLTQLGDETGAEEAYRDTRRRVQLEELIPAGEAAPAVRGVVERCADARLVVTSLNEASGETEVEVTHEALIRHWPRLRGWLDEDRSSLRLLASINESAQEWEGASRSDEMLPRWNMRLEEAEVLYRQPRFVQNALERDYLETCRALRDREQAEREEQERREREALEQAAQAEAQRAEEQARAASRLKKWFVGATVIGLVAIAASIVAVFLYIGSEKQKLIIQKERDNAKALEKIAQTERDNAQIERDNAKKQEKIAQEQEKIAQEEKKKAEEEKTKALDLGRASMAQALRTNRPTEAALVLLGLENLEETRFTLRSEALGHGSIFSYVVLSGHKRRVNSAVFSPDGKRVLTASYDKTARLWDADSGKEVHVLSGHEGLVRSAVFSSDSKRVLTASHDKTARLWDVDSGKEIRVFSGHDKKVMSAIFSSDGQRVLTASWDGTARIWPLTLDLLKRMIRNKTKICLTPSFLVNRLNESEDKARDRYEACEREQGR